MKDTDPIQCRCGQAGGVYSEYTHIQKAGDGKWFGHHREYKYRVMNRYRNFAIHHTNCINDAKEYFYKCRDQWIELDAKEQADEQ